MGTTVATNALLERKGEKTLLVTTRGFRDIPFLQRGHRKFHYDSSWSRSKPLVLRRDCFEVDERLTSHEAESRLALREKDWRKRKARLDAVAAAIILQDFLDHAAVFARDLRAVLAARAAGVEPAAEPNAPRAPAGCRP